MAEFNSVGHNRGYKKTTGKNLKESNKATSSTTPGVKFNFPGGGTVKVALKTIRFLSGLMGRVFGEGKPLFDFKISKVEVQAKEETDTKHYLKELGYKGKHLKDEMKNIENLPEADQMEALNDVPKSEDYFLGYTSKKDVIEDEQVAFNTLTSVGLSGKEAKELFSKTRGRSLAFSFRSTLYKMLADKVREHKKHLKPDHSSPSNTSIDNNAVHMDIKQGRVYYNKSSKSEKISSLQKKYQPQQSSKTVKNQKSEIVKNQKSKTSQKKSEQDHSSQSNTSIDNNAVHMDIKQGRVYYNKSGTSEKISNLQKKYQPQRSSKTVKNQKLETVKNQKLETVKNQKSKTVKNQKSKTSQKKSEQDHSSQSNTSIDNNAVHMDIKQGRVYYNKSGKSEKISSLQKKYQPQQSSKTVKNQKSETVKNQKSKTVKNQKSKTSQKKSEQDHSSQSNTSIDNNAVHMDIKQGRVYYNKSGKSEKISNLQKKYQPQQSSKTVKNQKSETVKNQKSKISQKKSEQDHSSQSNTSIDNNAVHMDIKQGRVYYNKSGTSEKISSLQKKYQPQQSSKTVKNQKSKTSQKKSTPHSTPANNDGISMDIKRGIVGYKK